MNFVRQLGVAYTYSAFGFAGYGAYTTHTIYRQMSKRGDFDKFPKWFNYAMYPMAIQSGMVAGIGAATYTPIALGVCFIGKIPIMDIWKVCELEDQKRKNFLMKVRNQ